MHNKSFSCYLIGDDNITLQCATILLEKNHQLLGIVSQSKKIQKWCISNDILHIKTLKELEKNYMHLSCDFLFSIANGAIFSPSILKYPRVYSINYHNGPLPKYAGLYATSWAILNDEKEHAISWHIMHEQIDSGDILKQKRFPIEEDETALSLNLKCYEHAIKAFRELLDEWATKTITLVQQNVSQRSYYGLKNKPESYGFILWNHPSERIDRLCRALTLGHYKNELVTPKLFLHDQILIIKSYRKLNIASKFAPGTLVHCSITDLQMTTSTTDIVLYELLRLNGEVYPLAQFIEDYTLAVGQIFPLPPAEYIQSLESHSAAIQPSIEKFWVKEHLNCIHGGVSFLAKLIAVHSTHALIKKINLSDKVFHQITSYSQNQHIPAKNIVVAILLIYIYRLNNYKNYTIDYSPILLKDRIGILDSILEHHIPFTTHFESFHSFNDVFAILKKEEERLIPYETYFKDIFFRYPELEGLSNEIDISITFFDTLHPPALQAQKKLNFYIANNGSSLYLHNNTNSQSHEESYKFLSSIEHHLTTLLNDAIHYPQKRLYELELIDNDEKEYLLNLWNSTQQSYDLRKLLHQDIEEQTLRTPYSIAVLFKNEAMTYEDLNLKSNQLAHCLIEQGIKPNDIVGIYTHRSLYMLISILGVLKSGAAYLPLDPHYPDKRINYMLENSKACMLLTHKGSVSQSIKGYQGLIIDVEATLKSNKFTSCPINTQTQSSDLAYIIYTSGTTGAPKGVAISHKSACNHMEWMRKAYGLNKNEVFLQKTPFSFDASVWEFFIPLWVGATLVIAPDDAYASPKELIDLVQKHKISILQLVPSMLREITLTPKFATCHSLRHVFCGGEVLLPETIRAFFEHLPSECALHNLYGPTEATIDALTQTCTLKDASSPVSCIGKPIANTKAFILDAHMQLVPIGIIGELYLAGAGLAKGYLHNDTLTQQKFLPHPFDTRQNERVYKTGDLVKWQNNGTIEYHERQDSQVKIRGFRIEISEIESCLEKIPSIYQCLVKPETFTTNELSLSAYLILIDNVEITATDIRSFLKKELPDYMIPTQFFVVEKLLTTPSGKLDRKNTMTPLRQLYSHKEHRTPQNEIEKALYEIWSSVLKTNHLGIDDNFFELGGHSLIAMNIISRIQEHFSITLPMRKLFDFPTVHSLSIEIEQLMLLKKKDGKELTLPEQIIIPIKETGNQVPLFLVHPIGGSIFWYKALATYLDKDIPLYGIQDPGLEKNDFFFQDIEQMATTYINGIKTIQPYGPYLIGGASFGSTIAVEIASQLQEMNETVHAIISLDGWAEYPSFQKNEAHFKALMSEQNAGIYERHLKHDIQHSERLLELQWHREKMLMHYKLPRIEAPLILFKASILTDLFNYHAPLNWWDNYSSEEIACYLVPGNHESMFSEPHIRIVAKTLSECLNKINSLL